MIFRKSRNLVGKAFNLEIRIVQSLNHTKFEARGIGDAASCETPCKRKSQSD